MLEVFVGCRCWARASIYRVWESWWPDVMHARGVGAAGSAEGFTRPWLYQIGQQLRSARYSSSRRFIHKSTHPYLRTRSLIFSQLFFEWVVFFFRNAVSRRAVFCTCAWPRLVLVKAGCQISWIIASTARAAKWWIALFFTQHSRRRCIL
jgi:hypothetical protein